MNCSRLVTAGTVAAFSFCLIACGGGVADRGKSSSPTERVAAGAAEISRGDDAAPQKGNEATAPKEPRGLSESERKRRAEAWRADLEDTATETAQKADVLETKIADLEATYKRRTEQGLIDGYMRADIEKFKKQAKELWSELAKIENRLAKGPPESLFAVEEPKHEPAPAPDKPSSGSSSEAASTYAQSSSLPSAPAGKVYVQGYTRKDGTYVKPHYRSSPKR